uniref:PH domain-containing protein n=1 Tax=Mola mola TaxID=94237 RepID=A0A3Q3WQ83_MOLML
VRKNLKNPKLGEKKETSGRITEDGSLFLDQTDILLTSYKDRYIHVEKTEVVVFEHEDLKNCLERLDLENYDKCHELKSPFKRKHRLILIRSPKSGNKVHDVKFQAQTVKEKEDWIKALSNGISRAKNKVFDSVNVCVISTRIRGVFQRWCLLC